MQVHPDDDPRTWFTTEQLTTALGGRVRDSPGVAPNDVGDAIVTVAFWVGPVSIALHLFRFRSSSEAARDFSCKRVGTNGCSDLQIVGVPDEAVVVRSLSRWEQERSAIVVWRRHERIAQLSAFFRATSAGGPERAVIEATLEELLRSIAQ